MTEETMKNKITLDSVINFMELIPKAMILISFNILFYALAYVGLENILHNQNNLVFFWTLFVVSIFMGIYINLKTIRMFLDYGRPF